MEFHDQVIQRATLIELAKQFADYAPTLDWNRPKGPIM